MKKPDGKLHRGQEFFLPTCPNCKKQMPIRYKICYGCGLRFMTGFRCETCGAERSHTETCPNCGENH